MNEDERSTTETVLTVTEAAKQAGVSRATVNAWILHGWLPAVRIDRQRRIRPDDLAATQARVHLGTVVPAWRQDRRCAGRRLRRLREAAGLSQLQLAAATGLTHELISRLERGERAPEPRPCAPSPMPWACFRRRSAATPRSG